MCVSWQVKCQLIGAFSLVFDIQWIHCQNLQQIELYLDDEYGESVSKTNVALHWRQNSCPGTTFKFLVFNYWAIWRVTTCSPLTLRICFINTPQHLLSLLSKTLPNTCSKCSIWSFLCPSHVKVLFSTNTHLTHFFQSHPNSYFCSFWRDVVSCIQFSKFCQSHVC